MDLPEYPINLIGLFGVVVLAYVLIFALFNTTLNTPGTRPLFLVIEIFLWILFLVIVFLNIQHYRNMDYDIHALPKRERSARV